MIATPPTPAVPDPCPPVASSADSPAAAQPATTASASPPGVTAAAVTPPDANAPATDAPANDSLALSPENTDPNEPYWLPAGVDLTGLPASVRGSLASVINPTYRELVLEAPTGLARSTGVTILHLLWLEILDQIELGRPQDPEDIIAMVTGDRPRLIARHLQVVQAKLKASELLMRVQALKREALKSEALRPPWRALPPEPPRMRSMPVYGVESPRGITTHPPAVPAEPTAAPGSFAGGEHTDVC